MPLLDSFKVDHTKMTAPAVRIAKTMKSKKGDDIRKLTGFHTIFQVAQKTMQKIRKKQPAPMKWGELDTEPVYTKEELVDAATEAIEDKIQQEKDKKRSKKEEGKN